MQLSPVTLTKKGETHPTLLLHTVQLTDDTIDKQEAFEMPPRPADSGLT